MSSRSTFGGAEEDTGYFEEYSVHVEVYDTEVTDSAGSTPIIKISGLCDSHNSAPYLMSPRSLSRLLDQVSSPSAAHICERTQLNRFQSLQVFRDCSNSTPPIPSAASRPCSNGTVALTGSCANLSKRENVPADVSLIHREQRFIAQSLSCSSVIVDATHDCGSMHCLAECSALGHHSSSLTRVSTCASGNRKFCTPSRRALRRSRKTTAIPSRLSGSFREAEKRVAVGCECTCTFGRSVGGACSVTEPLPGSHLGCMEEIITIHHLPAADRRKLVRRQECWGGSELSAVYRLLPSRRMRQGCLLAVSDLRTKSAEEEFGEIYVSDQENMWVDALSPSFPRSVQRKPPTVHQGACRANSLIPDARHTGTSTRDQETQTEGTVTATLPSTVTSLVEWFSATCYDLVARLVAIHANESDRSSSGIFSGANTDLWCRVMQHVQETMARVARPRDSGCRIDGMRGEGECPVERRAKETDGVPRMMSSRRKVRKNKYTTNCAKDTPLAQALYCSTSPDGRQEAVKN
ncbi:uncharacterized protein LOC144097603 [Amblyomma americanum]